MTEPKQRLGDFETIVALRRWVATVACSAEGVIRPPRDAQVARCSVTSVVRIGYAVRIDPSSNVFFGSALT